MKGTQLTGKYGLFSKYNVQKSDGSPVDPEAEYFVLRLDDGCSDKRHLQASREAVLVYADQIENHLPKLAQDLKEKYHGTVKLKATENFIHNKYGYCYYDVCEDRAFIYNLYVYPEYRLRGHAKRLLKYAILEIRIIGHEGEIEIEAEPRERSIDRECLIRFYQDIGLKVLARRENAGA